MREALLGEDVVSGKASFDLVPLELWSVKCITDTVLCRGRGPGVPVPHQSVIGHREDMTSQALAGVAAPSS